MRHRLLIFAWRERTARAIAASIPGAGVLMKGTPFAEALGDFRSRPDAVMVVVGEELTRGWTAPPGTVALLAEDFPDDQRLRSQALGRVDAAPAELFDRRNTDGQRERNRNW